MSELPNPIVTRKRTHHQRNNWRKDESNWLPKRHNTRRILHYNPTAIAQTGNTAPLHNFSYGIGPRGFTRRKRYGVLNPYTTISPLELWSTPERQKRTKYSTSCKSRKC